jgi:hypothetical protein
MKMTSQTGNGAPAFEHSTNHLLEFFSKGGSIKGKETYYTEKAVDNVELFKAAWYTGDKENALKLLFWVRDCRGGAGNRKTFRDAIKWLADTDSEWVEANVQLIPIHGRWDDLASLYNTPCEKAALTLWADAIISNDPNITPLAAKWADRQDFKLRKHMDMSPKAFRKLVVARTGWIVETAMCENAWSEIAFSKVPSVAGARLRKAFKAHQQLRYEQWCLDLASSKKINTSVLFPHDIVRLVKSTVDEDAAFETLVETMFETLPNYITDPNVKIMPICDFSGSMEQVNVSGKITAMDVSLALGMYCSDRLGKDNPFYRKLIPFSTDAKLCSWRDKKVLTGIREIPDRYVGSTNLKSALNILLDSAIMWNIKPDQMVTTLLILSDMQWDCAIDHGDTDVIEHCMDKWVKAGYKKPQIVFWNMHSYSGQPARAGSKDTAMISGFSPAILKTVLSNSGMDPVKVMMETISKYEITTP